MNIKKYDMIYGIVSEKKKNIVIIKTELINVVCICKENLNLGDKALFSVINFFQNSEEFRINLSCDSIIEYGIL